MATLLAAVVAGTVAVWALILRDRADKRDQWWQRAQWAMGLAISGDSNAVSIGLAALDQLATSILLGQEERSFLAAVGEAVIDHALDSGFSLEDTKSNEDER